MHSRRRFTRLLPFALNALLAQDSRTPFDTKSDVLFGDATVPLRELLRDRHVRSHNVQHFCVIGLQNANGEGKQAWVHWTEGNRIILWEGATDPLTARTAIARSRSVIDLRKDVVPREDDIKGSTFLVTRAWVNRIITDCAAKGGNYEVRPN